VTLLLARIVLGVLAVYHLSIGVVSLASHRAATSVVVKLYGVSSLDSAPQLRYATMMLGLQALAIGSLAAVAAWTPFAHRDVIAVLAALQAGRAVYRLVFRRLLREAFGIPVRRNALTAALLIAEAMVLIGVLA
jgi:hypothetical protein